MAYDYNSKSKTFELPNPYRFQNLIFLLCALALLAAGVYGLLMSREYLLEKAYKDAVVPVTLGVFLLGLGLRYLVGAFSRLRFFFGRGRPQPLAPQIAEGSYGSSAAADSVKEMMRQGALLYPEPQGALEGLLYHRIPRLITAPLVVQNLAKSLFVIGAVMYALLLSFAVAALTAGDANTLAWLSVLYGIFGISQVFRPLTGSQIPVFGLKKLILLIVAAVIAPVLITLSGDELPDLSVFSFHYQTTLLLVLGSVLVTVLFLAAVTQVPPPPNTEVSCDLRRMSLQCPPASVMDELERILQAGWVERIPNKRYAYQKPQTPLQAGSGEFAGDILEESQPVPLDGSQRGVFSVFSSSRERLAAVADLLSATLWVGFAVAAVLFLNRYDSALVSGDSWYSMLLVALILALLARFGLRLTEILWGRFAFQSVLTWVDMQGSFQVASVGTGNQLQSQMQTSTDFIRVENMTLRVWRTRIESVVFGKDQPRQVMALFSTDAEARSLGDTLGEYGAAQSVLAAPHSDVDRQKLAAISSADNQLQHAATTGAAAASLPDTRAALAALGAPASGTQHVQYSTTEAVEGSEQSEGLTEGSGSSDSMGSATAPAASRAFCTACGAATAAAAKFCGQCGSRLN